MRLDVVFTAEDGSMSLAVYEVPEGVPRALVDTGNPVELRIEIEQRGYVRMKIIEPERVHEGVAVMGAGE